MSHYPSSALPESYLASSTQTLDEEEDFIDDNSSTSTAGPPPESPRSVGGHFNRPWNLATAQLCSSGSTSPASSVHTRNTNNRTGTFHPITSSRKTGNYTTASRGFNRTLSNTSASVSPMGSSIPQEWGKSFRLFNTSRYLGSASGARQRDYMFKSVVLQGANRESERGTYNNNNSIIFHQRQNSSTYVHGSGHHSRSPESRGASVIFSAGSPYPLQTIGNNSIVAVSGSPMTGLSPQHTRSFSSSQPTNVSLAKYAMGGGQKTNVSAAQSELPALLNSLRTYLAINADTIIVGDAHHPLEIKRGNLIGAGGFAKVYVGLNTVRGELVAIKEMQIEDVDDFKALHAIEQEFALLKSLHHPNIVSYHLFEHSRSQKVCRIVMELLPGDSTLKLLQKFGPLTEAVLRKLARHLLNAIVFIHKEGIFHRDIKPANILVSHKGEVKLCDFGCSKRVSELSKASSCIIGTPVYMAPELIKGEDNHKADIWSMACSLFELGTGLQPWYHSGVRDNLPLMFYITTTSETPLVIPTQDNFTEFSPDFMHFMELCFTRDPDRRPEATELLKHPWVTGSRSTCVSPRFPTAFLALTVDGSESPGRPSLSPTKPLSPRDSIEDSFTSDVCATNSTAAATPQPVDDEILCQQELEEVSAAIAVDLCNAMMNVPEGAMRCHERRLAEATSATTETSPSLTRTQSVPSPSLSHRGAVSINAWDFTSPNATPEHSILHDNFHYNQLQLGASAGNFILPTDVPEATQQQCLRINEEGHLDFATLAEVDTDSLADTIHMKSGSVDSSLFAVSNNSRVVSPGRPGSFKGGRSSPAAAQFSDRRTSPHRSFSRGESPYRGPIPNLSPPQPIPAAPLAGGGRPSALLPRPMSPRSTLGGSEEHSSQSHSPLSVSTSSLRNNLPDKAKSQADGKLHMSFAVSTAPGQELNVELKVDMGDVHCKMIDNQPSYFVAFSDDVKGQITAKIKEAAAQSMSSAQSASSRTTTPRGLASQSGQFELPRAPAGAHFFNSPSFRQSRSPGRPPSRLSTVSSVSQTPASPFSPTGVPGGNSSTDGTPASASASRTSTPAPAGTTRQSPRYKPAKPTF